MRGRYLNHTRDLPPPSVRACFRRLVGANSVATPARYETPLKIVCVPVLKTSRQTRPNLRPERSEQLHTSLAQDVIVWHNSLAKCRSAWMVRSQDGRRRQDFGAHSHTTNNRTCAL